jgi:hypothetical protein
VLVSEIQTAVQAHGFGSDTAAAQLEGINQVERQINGKRRWPWLEKTTTGTLTVGTASYAVPADFRQPDSVRVEIGTEYYDLEYLRPVELRRLSHVDRDNSTPRYWTEYEGKLYFHPRPDRVYTYTLDYVKKVTQLTAGSTPLAPSDYHDVYVWGALMMLAARERDWQMHAFAGSQFRERVQEMEDEYNLRQRQSSSRVVRDRKRWSRAQ